MSYAEVEGLGPHPTVEVLSRWAIARYQAIP